MNIAGVEVELRENSRARRIGIVVRPDGSVRVTKPRRIPVRFVETFVQQNREWIERMRARLAQLPKTSRVESSAKEYKKYKKANK